MDRHAATARASAYPMLEMDAAWAALRGAAQRMLDDDGGGAAPHEVSTFAAASVGRVLAERVVAPRAVPAAACSRLDGYAVRAPLRAGAVYRVAARQRAGASAALTLPDGAVAWITTGGALPHGADAVVGVEASLAVDAAGQPLASAVARGSEEHVQFTLQAAVTPGSNVRAAGSDMAAGSLLLEAGHQLAPADLAALLCAGLVRVRVHAAVHVGVLSTGDELLSPEDACGAQALIPSLPVAATNAVIDSNAPMLQLLLGSLGVGCAVTRRGIVPDALEAVMPALTAACFAPTDGGGGASPSVLVVTGGVSMGDRDYVKPALEALVARWGGRSRVLFGRLNMKPGKPTTAALLDVPASAAPPAAAHAQLPPRRLVLVLALPGNPVSAFVGCHMLVAPVVKALSGLPWGASLPPTARVTMLDGVACDPERPEFHRIVAWAAQPPPAASPASVTGAGGGAPSLGSSAAAATVAAAAAICARSTGSQASSRLPSAVGCNALLWLPASSELLQPPFVGTAHLLGPLLAQAALPHDMTDVTRLRAVAPSSGPAAGSGCACGGHHDAASGPPAQMPPPARVGAAGDVTAAAAATAAVAATTAAPRGAYPPHATAPVDPLDVRFGVLTVSTRCAQGVTQDLSGPAVVAWVEAAFAEPGFRLLRAVWPPGSLRVVPDDAAAIHAAALQLVGGSGSAGARAGAEAGAAAAGEAAGRQVDVLITSGGTGMAPSDVTPEALRPLIARPAHGLQHAMLAASLRATPMAALSRYEAGVTAGGTLLLQLPGSPKAVRECLDALRAVLPHAVAQLQGK